jgi:hypothetical protein
MTPWDLMGFSESAMGSKWRQEEEYFFQRTSFRVG